MPELPLPREGAVRRQPSPSWEERAHWNPTLMTPDLGLLASRTRRKHKSVFKVQAGALCYGSLCKLMQMPLNPALLPS